MNDVLIVLQGNEDKKVIFKVAGEKKILTNVLLAIFSKALRISRIVQTLLDGEGGPFYAATKQAAVSMSNLKGNPSHS